jgi:hypothetical protein
MRGGFWLLALLMAARAAVAQADSFIEVKSGDFTLQAGVRAQANLVYHLDCLGRVVSCTSEVFELPWRGRLGLAGEDKTRIDEWASLRREIERRSSTTPPPLVPSLMPIHSGGGDRAWDKMRMAEFMAADADALAGVWSTHVPAATAERFAVVVAHFRPRFETWWNEHQGEAAQFLPGFEAALVKARAGELLTAAARLYRSDLGDGRISMHIMLQPKTERARSQATVFGSHVIVEMEPNEIAEERVPIVVHELAHHVFARMPAKRKAALVEAILKTGRAGPAAWNLFDEVQATVIGNILAGRNVQNGDRFKRLMDSPQGFYNDDAIDLGARATEKVFDAALSKGRAMRSSFAGDYVTALKGGMGAKLETPALYLRSMLIHIDHDASPWVRKLRRALRPGSTSTVTPLGSDDLKERLDRHPGMSSVVIATAEQLPLLQSSAAALGSTVETLTTTLGASRGVVLVSQRTPMAFTFFFIRRDDEAMDGLIAAFSACRLTTGVCVRIE